MRIQYCSDLHLEFPKNKEYLKFNPLQVTGEVLILAGDIIPLQDGFFKEDFFSFVSDHYEAVYWVPGNHEFYHRNLSEYPPSYKVSVRENLHLVNNIEVFHHDLRFLFTTLWSFIPEHNEQLIMQNVADFDLIEHNYRKIRSSDYNNLHKESLGFLQKATSLEHVNTVVVTHHLPSFRCDSIAHNSSPIKEAFCSNLDDWITSCGARFWIHGHSHYNHPPVFIGKTILLTNQMGYLHCNEGLNFRHNAFIVP